MATGIDEFIKISEANQKTFETREYAPELWPALRNDGDKVTVRFLEVAEEFEGAYFHMYQRPESRIWLKAVCLDQDGTSPNSCPGCVASVPKSFKGFVNVVWFDAPVYEKDSDGKLVKTNGEYKQVGTDDINAVWVQGITVFKALHQLDLAFKGLNARDFTITRSGKGKQTQYMVIPTGDDPYEVDKKFIENKFDLSNFTKPQDVSELSKIFLNSQEEVAQGTDTGSPWKRKSRFED